MAAEDEVKPTKRGRGRPPKADGEKKAPKRKAEPAVDEDGNPLQKKGRGRPPGGGKKKAAKAKPAKGVSHRGLLTLALEWPENVCLKINSPGGQGQGPAQESG